MQPPEGETVKHVQNVGDAWIAVNVRQQRTKGSPIGAEALPDNRLGRRIKAKLAKKAAAMDRNTSKGKP
jgi:hypothetical protein